MAKRLTRQESQARTRDRLITTAERVFLKKGYHDASIGQIAEAAGYTTGAVYSNFSNKEELAFGVLERHLTQVAAGVVEALANSEPTVAARLHAVEGLWDTMLGDEQWLVLSTEFILATRHKPAIRSQFVRAIQVGRQMIAGLLTQQEQEMGIGLPASADRLAAGILAYSVGLSVLRIGDPTFETGTFSEMVGLVLGEVPAG